MSEGKFKVSALKFRPQTFADVVSQEFVTTTLKNAIINKKIAHSYLFSGPRGVGKTTIARVFAKAINCKNAKGGEPCNDCENCSEITKGVHPDVFELDAASNRGIDEMRGRIEAGLQVGVVEADGAQVGLLAGDQGADLIFQAECCGAVQGCHAQGCMGAYHGGVAGRHLRQ